MSCLIWGRRTFAACGIRILICHKAEFGTERNLTNSSSRPACGWRLKATHCGRLRSNVRPHRNCSGGIMKPTNKPPLNGPHKELFADGTRSGEGRFKHGKRHGKWAFYYKGGGLKAVGKYANGELDGYWEWWRENGKPLQAGAFDCGKQVGPWKRYYENGQLWDKGEYVDGKKVGEWKVYEKGGELKQSKT